LAGPALVEVLRGQPSLEVRQRAQRILDKVQAERLPADQVRVLRALEVLETIGTPEARQVLEALARGALDARLTQEAHAACHRLAARAANSE
jgi:hypothetical protein